LKKLWIYLLIVVALAAGAAFVACGGDEDEDGGKATPVAEENGEAENGDAENGDEEATPVAEENGEAEDGGGEGSIGDVPVYPGAKEVMSGEWSGSEAAIPMMGAPMDPEDYGTVEYAMYETDDSAEEVFGFYEDEMKGWNEEWTFSGGDETGMGGMGIWSKDDGAVAAWIVVSEEDGTTSLMIGVGY
jgi:hypothetical protein